MKKQIIAGILGLTMVAGMSTPAFAAEPVFVHEEENNNTFSKANEFKLTNIVIIDGKAYEGDKDYYKFTPDESGSYKFDFGRVNNELPAGEAEVTLYDADRNEIRSKRVNSRNLLEFTEDLKKGKEYYLKVKSTYTRSYEYVIWIIKQN
ncbi:hypothetical protein [Paenibacillus alvei]|uniref:hypothetical protein n=1 Tax=Paenibacillus alvei TaxID=44250 RepID=UPI0018CEA4F6|nr:hypothetical protein [Paenibacillus alvei]MBG9737540.1 hypothetical protein [Paenibacillus alvei]MBG9747231.1 hypothetical protein [Paenibacillus alvei]MCY9581290.1 hypothetical protein [Paenibacillus alvei]MCY9584420.1 hypothetical protein [Paenibacillus alvei]